MRTGTVSYRLEDLKNGVIIPIGFVGENDFTKVFFDAEEIYKKYPSASVSMKVQPPKGVIYPAAVTRDGNTVIWQVKESDVANRGGGELQLTFIDGETKIKTYIARTDVKRSLAGNGPAPDPIQDWIDDAEEVLDDLEAMDTIAKNTQASDIGKALSPKTVENGVVTEWEYITPGGGTEDYTDLDNKPSIAGVTLSGNKTLEDLGIAADDDLDNLADEVSDVKTAIQGLDDEKYEKPSGGIPATDLTQAVQNSLGAANSAYQKPSGGIPASDIADGVIPVVDSALSYSSENAVQNKVVKGALDTKAPVIINTATGNPAVFNDGGGMPLKSLLIPFTPVQSGTGDPSPQNIRNILPWNGLAVFGGGKNLLNHSVENSIPFKNANYNKYTLTDGVVVTSGNTLFGFKVKVKPNTTYWFTFDTSESITMEIFSYTTEPSVIKNDDRQIINIDNNTWNFTTFADTEWISCGIYTSKVGVTVRDFRLTAGSAQEPYEPYVPITETDIFFPSPVYGGTLDVASGVLTVDTVCDTFTWENARTSEDLTNVTRKVFELSNLVVTTTTKDGKYCDKAIFRNDYSADTVHFYTVVVNGTPLAYVYLPIGTPDTETVQIAYPIATPQEIQLTPQQLTALVGDNTIWSDADGSMIVEYPADTALFIANQHRNFIAPELSSMIADTALVKNDFRIVGNNLYKITSAIASGGTLTPNTNCVKTTLAEVIKPLLT